MLPSPNVHDAAELGVDYVVSGLLRYVFIRFNVERNTLELDPMCTPHVKSSSIPDSALGALQVFLEQKMGWKMATVYPDAMRKLGDDMTTMDAAVNLRGSDGAAEVKTMVEALPPHDPRYVIFDYDFVGDKSDDLIATPIMLLWCPDRAGVRDKMIYSASMSMVRRHFESKVSAVPLQASDLSDLTPKEILASLWSYDVHNAKSPGMGGSSKSGFKLRLVQTLLSHTGGRLRGAGIAEGVWFGKAPVASVGADDGEKNERMQLFLDDDNAEALLDCVVSVSVDRADQDDFSLRCPKAYVAARGGLGPVSPDEVRGGRVNIRVPESNCVDEELLLRVLLGRPDVSVHKDNIHDLYTLLSRMQMSPYSFIVCSFLYSIRDISIAVEMAQVALGVPSVAKVEDPRWYVKLGEQAGSSVRTGAKLFPVEWSAFSFVLLDVIFQFVRKAKILRRRDESDYRLVMELLDKHPDVKKAIEVDARVFDCCKLRHLPEFLEWAPQITSDEMLPSSFAQVAVSATKWLHGSRFSPDGLHEDLNRVKDKPTTRTA